MAIAKIVIENFRGIQSLNLSNLPQAVLLGGRNGWGKTSVLEALALFASEERIGALLGMNRLRLYPLQTMASIPSVFYRNIQEQSIQITGGSSDGKEWRVRYRITEREAFDYSTAIEQEQVAYGASLALVAEVDFFQGGDWKLKQRFQGVDIGEGRWNIRQDFISKGLDARISNVFLASSTTAFTDFNALKDAIVQGGERIIVDALRKIDGRIRGIQLVGDRVMVELDGIEQLLPLQSIGDGLQKVVRVLAFLYLVRDGGILCIDELGNGLHYSACRVVWDAILSFVQRYKNVQVFITTHWNEILTSAVEAYENLGGQKDFCYINLVKNYKSGSIDPVCYAFEALKSALSLGMEVR